MEQSLPQCFFEIRNATKSDLIPLCELEEDVFKEDAYPKTLMAHYLRESLRKGRQVIILLAGCHNCQSSLVGCIMGEVDEDRKKNATIVSLGIRKEHQNHGLGKLLLQAMCDRFHLRGISSFSLHVSVRNDKAIHLYQKMGFRHDGRIADYYGTGHDAFEMIKTQTRET